MARAQAGEEEEFGSFDVDMFDAFFPPSTPTGWSSDHEVIEVF